MADEKHGPGEPFPTIAARYGRTMEVWGELIEESGIAEESRLAAWLETEHGVGSEHAASLASYFLDSDKGPEDTAV